MPRACTFEHAGRDIVDLRQRRPRQPATCDLLERPNRCCGVQQPGPDSHDASSDPRLQALVRAIADHGNLLTFCDGFTIVPGQSAHIRGALEGWVGVSVEPVHYLDASQDLESLSQVAGVRHLHLDEVINGRKAWANHSTEDRMHWVEVLCHHALHWIKRVDVLMLSRLSKAASIIFSSEARSVAVMSIP